MNNYPIKNLFIYPIKSIRGIEVSRLTIDTNGLKLDREFMVLDRKTNKMVTQRTHPQMTTLIPTIDSNKITITDNKNGKSISFDYTIDTHLESFETMVWKDHVTVVNFDKSVDEFFSNFLKLDGTLVTLAKNSPRIRKNSSIFDHSSFETKLSDAYPILLCDLASLKSLNSKLAKPISIERFRPNIVIDSNQAFLEDKIKQSKIGDINLISGPLCERCTIPNVDESSGSTSKEPLNTLNTFRKIDDKICFGLNLVPQNLGSISLRNRFEVSQQN